MATGKECVQSKMLIKKNIYDSKTESVIPQRALLQTESAMLSSHYHVCCTNCTQNGLFTTLASANAEFEILTDSGNSALQSSATNANLPKTYVHQILIMQTHYLQASPTKSQNHHSEESQFANSSCKINIRQASPTELQNQHSEESQ